MASFSILKYFTRNLLKCILLLVLLIFKSGQCILIEKELETNKSIDVTSDPNYKLLPSLEECGYSNSQHRQKRIVGGKPTSWQKFPWMAQLYFINTTSANSSLNCGGTVITKHVIMTAAHCLSRLTNGMSFVNIAFGQSDRRKIKLCGWDKEKNKKCSKKFTRRIKKIVINEKYNEGDLDNDIGLIFLDKPVRFSSRIRPICLPYSEELLKSWVSTKLRVVGWGLMTKMDAKPKTLANNLLEVDIHIRERKYCNRFHSRQYGKLKGNRFCAAGEPGVGSCNGDSGSPLLKKLPVPSLDGKERVFQFGIVSSGNTGYCGYDGMPSIYTNVLFHVPWILSNLKTNYSLESVESFSAELKFPSSEEESENEEQSFSAETVDNANDSTKYKNELSTGLDVDVLSHPNLPKLAKTSECGMIPPPKEKKKDSEDDYDASVSVEYDDEKDENYSKESHSRQKRMVGGRVAEIGWFPFLVQINVKDSFTGEENIQCGGMIISQSVILTAASCVTELGTWALDSVRVGNHNRNKTNAEECLGKDECFKGKTYSIKEVVIHKEYEKFTFRNDIALIKIAGKLEFTRVVQPICLPLTELIVEELKDTLMISVGWGRVKKDNDDEKNPYSNIPKYTEVQLKPREYCEKTYKRFLNEMGRARICGDGESGKGECNGDTGGPLLKPLKVLNAKGKKVNKYVQFGIISFDECGQQGLPTIYTNLLFYIPWILDNL